MKTASKARLVTLALAGTVLLGACSTQAAQSPVSTSTDSSTVDGILAAGATAPDSAIPPGSAMAKIRDRGEFIVGGVESSALFSLRDPLTGKLTGFDAALAQLLAKYITGKPAAPKLVNVTSDTREALVANGTVDAVFATYTITPARQKKVAFAGPYYSSGDSVLVRKSSTDIGEVGDLNGKTVVTQSSSTAADALKKFAPNATVQLFTSNAECVQALQQGRADAYVIDESLLLSAASRNHDLTVVGRPFTSEPYGIGLSQSAPELRKFINDWLHTIQQDGTWTKIWQATIGTVVKGSAPQPPAIG